MKKSHCFILVICFFSFYGNSQDVSHDSSVSVNSETAPPSASFIINPSDCYKTNTPIQLISTTNDADSWEWVFPTGPANAYAKDPTVIFNDYGYHCIVHIASNSCGSDTVMQSIYVTIPWCDCDSVWDMNGLTVNYNQHLTGPLNIKGDIIIKTGNSLELNGNFYFHPQSRIIVEEGARLILVGTPQNPTILDKHSMCEMWQGIEVWGQTDQESDFSLQGIVEMESCHIKNAHVGILLGMRNMDCLCDESQNIYNENYSGGIVYCVEQGDQERFFLNNGAGIRYVYKQNRHSFNNKLRGLFMNMETNFLFDDKYMPAHQYEFPSPLNPWAGEANPLRRTWRGIETNNLEGIVIYSSNFENLYCGTHFTNSQCKIDRCNFFELSYGAYIINSTQTAINFQDIRNSRFDRITMPTVWSQLTAKGIYILNGFADVIYNNEFDYSNTQTLFSEMGVHLENSIYHKITENLLQRQLIGIYTNSSKTGMIGADVPFYEGNQFRTCLLCIQTRGGNSKLVLKCNDHHPFLTNDGPFNNNWKNIGYWGDPVQIGNTYATPLLTLGNQGQNVNNRKLLAGNTFNVLSRRHIQSNFYYRYYHHDISMSGAQFQPVTAQGTSLGIVNKAGIAYIDDAKSCSPKFNLDTISIIGNLNVLRSAMDSLNIGADIIWQNFTTALENLDKGQTLTLISAIEGNMSEGQLKNLLISNSPLSDTVIYVLIQENALAPGNFKNVMEHNLPVSNWILPEFVDYCLKLPLGIRNQLLALQVDNSSTISPEGYLRQWDDNRMEFGTLMTDGVCILSSLGMKDQVIELLEKDPDATSAMILISTYLEDGDLVKAQTKLLELTQKNTFREPAINKYNTQMQSLVDLYSHEKTIYEMDSTFLEQIRLWAWQCPEYTHVFQARAILKILTGEEIPPCLDNIQERNINHQVKPEGNSCPWLGNSYPDPATHTTTISYFLPENETYTIRINSILGMPVEIDRKSVV